MNTPDARRIVEALGGTWNGNSGECRCPVHVDSNPSLSVSESDGKVLIYCFGGCSQESVIAALRAEGLWPEPERNFAEKFQYLQRAGVPSEGIEYLRKKRGLSRRTINRTLRNEKRLAWSSKKQALVFPLMSPDRTETAGLQYIPIDGSKKTFAKGTDSKRACFYIDNGSDETVVTEAIIDALSVFDACPDVNICSIMSASSLGKIKAVQGTPILFLDNDEAGKVATRKAIVELGEGVRVVDWTQAPEGMKDVNDLLRAGHRDIIAKMIESSRTPTQEELEAARCESEKPKPDLPGQQAEKGTQAQRLIQLAADATLFHTPEDGHYAIIPQNTHKEVWPTRSKGFKNWLVHRFYLDQGKPPGAQALQDALGVLEAHAQFDGEEHPVFVRVGEHGGNIYIDLCNNLWEVVEITASGWRLISGPPVRFRRSRGMLSLPHPVRGGNLEELKSFLNLPDDGGVFCLISGFLVQCFNPSGPYPILNLEGEQGTGKSHTAYIMRSLVDPSTAMLRTVPREERDLMIAANNSWLLAFDNLSGVPDWLSDALCRLSTGGGLSTRELYTDTEEIIFEARRPQILTGIDRISSRHDLIDRSIIITLPVIPDDKRREEKEIWLEFEAARPRILGALLDAVSCALRNISTTKLERLPRMADFAKWVTAAEPALPWESGGFMEAYAVNRKGAIILTLDADVVAVAVIILMDSVTEWSGTPTELLETLKGLVSDDTLKLRTWPKAANSLTRRLRRMATFLRTEGIEVSLPDSGSWHRDIAIRKHAESIADIVEIVEIRTGQESAINDPISDKTEINDNIVDAQNTVEISLTGKRAPDKPFRDINGINDKNHTRSKRALEARLLARASLRSCGIPT
ncbi:MAG: toprim domain-containing protein [Syntrophobacteraceae bacterium]|jgi:hypothetical protein